MQYQDLPVASRPGANADHWDSRTLGDFGGQIIDHALQQQQVRPRLLQRKRRLSQFRSLVGSTPMPSDAIHLGQTLRTQAQMRTDRQPLLRQAANDFDLLLGSLKFDHLCATLLHQPRSVGLRHGHVAATHVRQVADQQGAPNATGNALRVVDHVVHRHRPGGAMPLDDHAKRIADQDELDSACIQYARERCVVSRQAGKPTFPLPSHPAQSVECHKLVRLAHVPVSGTIKPDGAASSNIPFGCLGSKKYLPGRVSPSSAVNRLW